MAPARSARLARRTEGVAGRGVCGDGHHGRPVCHSPFRGDLPYDRFELKAEKSGVLFSKSIIGHRACFWGGGRGAGVQVFRGREGTAPRAHSAGRKGLAATS